MLSHRAILWNAEAVRRRTHPRPANHSAYPASLTDVRALQQAQEPVRERLKGHSTLRRGAGPPGLLLEPWTIGNGLLTATLKVNLERRESRF